MACGARHQRTSFNDFKRCQAVNKVANSLAKQEVDREMMYFGPLFGPPMLSLCSSVFCPVVFPLLGWNSNLFLFSSCNILNAIFIL